MGIRFRKSINLGGGFRVNLSKSGVGYSYGVKGARITKTARGTTRKTVGIPGTGIYYTQEEGNHNASSNKTTPPCKDYGLEKSTNIMDVSASQPSEYQAFLNAVKKVQATNLISTLLICTFILCAIPFFIITGIIGIILKVYVHTKMPVSIEYELDDYSTNAYNNLTSTWMELNNNKKLWQILSATSVENKKAHGGASNSLKRVTVKAIKKCPYFIKTNIEPFGLKMKGQSLLFFPDKLLIVKGLKIGAVKYEDIQLGLGTSNFLEDEQVPSDAKVVGKTWLKVNKKWHS